MHTHHPIKTPIRLRQCALSFLLAVLLLPSLLQAQLPTPTAHYPLYVMFLSKQKPIPRNVVQAWDVSGNGNHGNTFDNVNNTFYDYAFKRDLFPDATGVSVLKKDVSGTNLNVAIPDPFPGFGSTPNSFSLSFWVYWTNGNSNTETVLSSPNVVVRLANGAVQLGLPGSGSLSLLQFPTGATGYNGDGWYFIGITHNLRAPANNLYICQGTNLSAGLAFSTSVSSVGTIPNPAAAQLLDNNFVGSLCNVRIYNKQPLNSSQFQEIRQEDYNVGEQLQANTQQSYIQRNMYGWYPLNATSTTNPNGFKTNAITRFNTGDAIGSNGVTGYPDRFGRTDSAANLSGVGTYIQTPPFFGSYLDNYVPQNNNIQKGFTISYWVNKLQSQSSPTGGLAPPFTSSDVRNKIFYGKDNSADLVTGQGAEAFGMQNIVDRLGLFRYNDIVSGQRYHWYFWQYDSMSFRNNTGWFHVVYVQNADWLTVHLYYPNGSHYCQSVYWEIQNLTSNNIVEWALGSKGGTQSTSLVLDDFKIYNWPMIPLEVNTLDAFERQSQGPVILSTCNCDTQQESPDEQPPPSFFIVYPNPSKGQVTVTITAPVDGDAALTLTSVTGKVVFNQQVHLQKEQQQNISLNHLSLANGLYVVRVNGAGINETKELLIQQ